MKQKLCTSENGRHSWAFKHNVIVKTVRETLRHTHVTLTTKGKYECATCGGGKYGASHIALDGDARN